ncbi:endonuclease [Mesobaculum littorinae]|uniref:endonuclease n=1 Tax=Mesobaculum littorinae TaxID=2486419 RepID=UPI001F3EE7B2|nr:endonuclease [Mesobaculum littorinae]
MAGRNEWTSRRVALVAGATGLAALFVLLIVGLPAGPAALVAIVAALAVGGFLFLGRTGHAAFGRSRGLTVPASPHQGTAPGPRDAAVADPAVPPPGPGATTPPPVHHPHDPGHVVPANGHTTAQASEGGEIRADTPPGPGRDTPPPAAGSRAGHSTGQEAGQADDTAPVRPQALAAPRAGGADDLRRIHGVGPKLEQQLHDLGIWHFDQIAGWTKAEVAWMDSHLEGFSGRVSRDNWTGQAAEFARATPDHSDGSDRS